MFSVRPVLSEDRASWLSMRSALWPDGSAEEHASEIDSFFSGRTPEPQAVLVADDGAGNRLGFVELSIRSCAEGCHTSHVAYLEGWFVVESARKTGVGRALVEAAEAWGREQGCVEFASDTLADNRVSAIAHERLGFEDVGLIRCYRKDL